MNTANRTIRTIKAFIVILFPLACLTYFISFRNNQINNQKRHEIMRDLLSVYNSIDPSIKENDILTREYFLKYARINGALGKHPLSKNKNIHCFELVPENIAEGFIIIENDNVNSPIKLGVKLNGQVGVVPEKTFSKDPIKSNAHANP